MNLAITAALLGIIGGLVGGLTFALVYFFFRRHKPAAELTESSRQHDEKTQRE